MPTLRRTNQVTTSSYSVRLYGKNGGMFGVAQNRPSLKCIMLRQLAFGNRQAMLGVGSTLRAVRRVSADCFRRHNTLFAGRAVDRAAAASKVPTHCDSNKLYYHSFRPCSANAFKFSPTAFFSTASTSTNTSDENEQDEDHGGGAVVTNLESPAESPFTKSSILDAYSAIELALDSVVKIFTVSSSPNYFLPWQNKSQRESTGSGFVIPGKKILTNAHVVADHTFVLVRKHGSPTKYRAKVQAIGHECDLAILVVENEEFWEGTNSLELGDIPFLQEAVAVVGYPQGGDNISVTKGVVSRVEPTQYVHGASQLLAIQIDAAINPGNSGGPAIMGDKVAGVAFQNLSGAENIGYIIPVPVIRHFIAGVEENGNYVGFCSMGLSCQPAENLHLRQYFQMGPECTGVLVSKINPLSDAYRVLKKDDIILSFDGVPIANDGTVTFRNRERITFDHLVSMKKPNETAEVKVFRNGEELQFSIKIFPLKPLVPVHQFDKLPSYYIFAGLIFIPLTQPYLHEYGEDWYNSSPRRLCSVSIPFSSQLIGSPARPLRRSSVGFRKPLRVSASCATAERTATASQASLYEVLGIPPRATFHEIKAAYRRLAMVLHPDVRRESSAEDFIIVHAAYSTLSDPLKRAKYDRTLFRPAAFSGINTRRRWETDQCW